MSLINYFSVRNVIMPEIAANLKVKSIRFLMVFGFLSKKNSFNSKQFVTQLTHLHCI